MQRSRVDYRGWLLRVVGWDGMLPAAVVVIPTLIKLLLPNKPDAIAIAAAVFPPMAFVLRAIAGKRHIFSNGCTTPVRHLQFLVFSLGILVLVLIDCLLVLSHVLPGGGLAANQSARLFWVILIAIYLTAMIIAMYPGREAVFAPRGNGDETS